MTLQQFLADYRCTFNVANQGNVNLVVVSQAIRRSDNNVVDAVTTTINIQETNDWIVDSQSMISVTPWDWNKLIDQAKRAHLDYFVQRAPIDNYYPLDTVANPDISNMYI